MQRFQNRNLGPRIAYSWPAIAVLFLAVVFLGKSAVNAYLGATNTHASYIEIKNKREDLLAKNADLEKRLDYLSNPYGLERELRRKFGLIKPGEEALIIVDRPKENQPAGESSNFSDFFSGVIKFLGGFFSSKQ